MVSVAWIVGVLRVARITGVAIVSIARIAIVSVARIVITRLLKIEAPVGIVWVTPQGSISLGYI